MNVLPTPQGDIGLCRLASCREARDGVSRSTGPQTVGPATLEVNLRGGRAESLPKLHEQRTRGSHLRPPHFRPINLATLAHCGDKPNRAGARTPHGEATDLAKGCPVLQSGGTVEVRPVMGAD